MKQRLRCPWCGYVCCVHQSQQIEELEKEKAPRVDLEVLNENIHLKKRISQLEDLVELEDSEFHKAKVLRKRMKRLSTELCQLAFQLKEPPNTTQEEE